MNEQNYVHFYQLVGHIESGRNVEAKSMLNQELAQAANDYGTLLHYTAVHDNAVIARELIRLGAVVDHLGEKNETPLTLAVDNDSRSVVEVLLEANADINIRNDVGDSALIMAFNYDNFQNDIAQAFVRVLKVKYPTTEELAKTLITCGCDNLIYAAFFDFDVMKYMLEHGIDINSCYDGEMTTLHAAVDMGNLDVITWLIDKGADVNAADRNGQSVLLHAVHLRLNDVVKILLEKGADPNCLGPVHNMDTPLYACFTRFSFTNARHESDDEVFECAKLLLQYGAVSYGYCSYTDRSMFDHALDWPTDKGVKLFISYVAVPEFLDAPISNLAKHCHLEANRLRIPEFANFYDQCLRVLKTAILEQVSLFDLLKPSEYTMRVFARDQTFVPKIKAIDLKSEDDELQAFYLKKVIKRIDYASDMVKLEDEAIPVICRLFNSNYNLCYTVARNVVGYLNERDFQQLLQV